MVPLPQVVDLLSKAAEWPKGNILPKQIYIGSIVSFHYVGQRGRPIHDVYPFVLVSDIYSNAIRGVNLNYLDSFYVSRMIISYLDTHFSYANIKNSNYLVDAFRTYKHNGIGQLKIYESKFLRALAYVAPRIDPYEVAQIEQQIEILKQEALRQPEA